MRLWLCYSHLIIVIWRILPCKGFWDFHFERNTNSSAFLRKVLNNPNFRLGADACENNEPSECDPYSPYRTFDGSCNNLKHPEWGRSGDCLLRVLGAAYEGESGILQSANGGPRLEPRILSLKIFKNKNRPTRRVNFFFTVFGQIVAHEISAATPPIGPGVVRIANITCCPLSEATNQECLPILIPKNDPFYSRRNITCINFLRGNICNACKNTGKRNIANVVTAALDVHLVYGINKNISDSLRTNDGTGKLRVGSSNGVHDLLPNNREPNFPFCPLMMTNDCFTAGDVRVNQHTFLASSHTILMREHNRIADELKRINPHWDGNKIFHTARRILDGKIQVIIYKEYLPLLLGPRYMSKFNLYVRRDGKGTQYDSSLRFGAWVESSSATFRAHSMVVKDTGFEEFRYMYENPYPIRDGNLSRVLGGTCMKPSQKYDRFAVEDITNYLYREPGDDYGLDLVAVDIQRGRDHGLPVYVDVLNFCNSAGKKVTSFSDLTAVMTRKNVELLKENYEDIRDIDLYVGMQLETIMKDAELPPTSACTIAGLFYFLKYGDRFYFEHINQAGSFTTGQRESLKNFDINRLLCQNTHIQKLQKNAFLRSKIMIPCHLNRGNDVDLNLWKEYTSEENYDYLYNYL